MFAAVIVFLIIIFRITSCHNENPETDVLRNNMSHNDVDKGNKPMNLDLLSLVQFLPQRGCDGQLH